MEKLEKEGIKTTGDLISLDLDDFKEVLCVWVFVCVACVCVLLCLAVPVLHLICWHFVLMTLQKKEFYRPRCHPLAHFRIYLFLSALLLLAHYFNHVPNNIHVVPITCGNIQGKNFHTHIYLYFASGCRHKHGYSFVCVA